MSNEEFLRRLEAALKNRVPQEDVDDAMNYHREYFAEAGENAAEELPSPESVAEQIVREREGYLRKQRVRWGARQVGGGLCIVALVLMLAFGIRSAIRKALFAADFVAPPSAVEIGTDVKVEAAEEMIVDVVDEGDGSRTVTRTLKEFDAIVIEDISDHVSITSGDDYTLTMRYKDRESPNYSVENGTLYISATSEGNFLSFSEQRGDISITVLLGVELSQIFVDVDMGSITLSGVNATDTELYTDDGNITVTDAAFRSLDCDSDLGSVTVISVEADSLTCYCDTGEIMATEFSAVQAELEADLGSVTAVAVGSQREYGLNLETDLGAIEVGGQEVSNPYASNGRDASRTLHITADVGSVSVDFTGASSARHGTAS